jgi:hypothetical protein
LEMQLGIMDMVYTNDTGQVISDDSQRISRWPVQLTAEHA